MSLVKKMIKFIAQNDQCFNYYLEILWRIKCFYSQGVHFLSLEADKFIVWWHILALASVNFTFKIIETDQVSQEEILETI